MRTLTLYEHGTLRAVSNDAGWGDGKNPWEETVPRRWFDRLRRFDESRNGDPVFDWRSERAKATQFVGVIQLGGVTLEILPKVERVPQDEGVDQQATVRRNLLWFLARAGDVPARERDIASLRTSRAPLLDALIALFAARLWDELLHGVARTYVTCEENLRRLRGRLVIAQQIARNAAHRERFACRYDEFSEDGALNRVLRCAAEVLLRQTSLPGARQTLGRCVEVLDGVTPLTPERARLTASRLVLDRQTARFAPLLAFARMALDAHSPEAIAGDAGVFSLLFDMNRVFEGLVTDLVRRAVPEVWPGAEARAQSAGYVRYLYAGAEHPKNLLPMEPDVLVVIPSPGGPATRFVVVDAKWKRIEPGTKGMGPRREDLYQMHGYGTRYGADALVLHPRGGAVGVESRSWSTLDHTGRALHTVTFASIDVSRDFSRRENVVALETEVRNHLLGPKPKGCAERTEGTAP
jgi:5-methylcytosine-specific restriction enzyme subunit McrC